MADHRNPGKPKAVDRCIRGLKPSAKDDGMCGCKVPSVMMYLRPSNGLLLRRRLGGCMGLMKLKQDSVESVTQRFGGNKVRKRKWKIRLRLSPVKPDGYHSS